MTGPDGLRVGVAAHTSRIGMARELADRVGADVLNVNGHEGGSREDAIIACAANHLQVLRRLWRSVAGHEWLVVLEDDALPIPDFRVHAAAALSCAPSPVIGFYINRAGTAHNLAMLCRAGATGAAWMVANHLVSAVAYAVRADHVLGLLDMYTQLGYERTVEERLTYWAAGHRRTVYGEPRFYYTMPSLVDHAVGESIIFPEVDRQIRRAWRVGFASDWDTPAVEYDPVDESLL